MLFRLRDSSNLLYLIKRTGDEIEEQVDATAVPNLDVRENRDAGREDAACHFSIPDNDIFAKHSTACGELLQMKHHPGDQEADAEERGQQQTHEEAGIKTPRPAALLAQLPQFPMQQQDHKPIRDASGNKRVRIEIHSLQVPFEEKNEAEQDME